MASSPVLKRKRETVYDVAPLMSPPDYVPFYASTLEYAELLKGSLESANRNRFTLNLDWDEMSPDRHISVTIGGYAPSHLFDFAVSAREV